MLQAELLPSSVKFIKLYLEQTVYYWSMYYNNKIFKYNKIKLFIFYFIYYQVKTNSSLQWCLAIWKWIKNSLWTKIQDQSGNLKKGCNLENFRKINKSAIKKLQQIRSWGQQWQSSFFVFVNYKNASNDSSYFLKTIFLPAEFDQCSNIKTNHFMWIFNQKIDQKGW